MGGLLYSILLLYDVSIFVIMQCLFFSPVLGLQLTGSCGREVNIQILLLYNLAVVLPITCVGIGCSITSRLSFYEGYNV